MDGPVGVGAAYIRVSRDVQQTERQRSAIGQWAERKGVVIGRWFEDSGSRDRSEKRADFQQLLRFVEQGEIPWIVVEDLDRFGTSGAYELIHYVHQLRKYGTQLWTAADDLCVSEGDDKTILTNVIRGMTSEKEQLSKGERAISAKLVQARKGLWTGGYAPFGCDVVCIRDGVVAWRLVFEGRDRRLQLVGDDEIRYDGKGNVPPHAKHLDLLYLTPSIREERPRAVVDAFTWYAEESISFGRIAGRLNDQGVDPVYARAWYAQIVEHMLMNPVYLGFPTYNKRAHGRFYEYQGGRIARAPRKVNDRPISGRWRAEEDQVAPERPIFDPIVEPELFLRVKEKLEARAAGKARRAPKSDELWLSGLVYCGKCGRVMAGASFATEKSDQRSYLCQTANRYRSGGNTTGCRCHRVKHTVLEGYVRRYLSEVGRDLDESADGDGLLRTNKAELRRHGEKIAELQDRAYAYLEDAARSGGPGADIAQEGLATIRKMDEDESCPEADWNRLTPIQKAKFHDGYLFQTYREVFGLRREATEALIREKEIELGEMVFQYRDLTSTRAREVANRQMEAIGDQISSLEALLEPLGDERAAWLVELGEIRERFRAAFKAVEEADLRRRAEALRAVISSITCYFEYRQHGQQTRSVLSRVDIEAVGEEPRSFSSVNSPGRDWIRKGFSRSYRLRP